MSKDGDNGSLGRTQRLQALLEQSAPSDYESVRLRLRVARELFHDELAAQFQDALERRLTDKRADVRETAKSLNADLRLLGLALECPVTRQPAVLVASMQDGPRLYYELLDSDPPRRKTALLRPGEPVRLLGFPDRGDRRSQFR